MIIDADFLNAAGLVPSEFRNEKLSGKYYMTLKNTIACNRFWSRYIYEIVSKQLANQFIISSIYEFNLTDPVYINRKTGELANQRGELRRLEYFSEYESIPDADRAFVSANLKITTVYTVGMLVIICWLFYAIIINFAQKKNNDESSRAINSSNRFTV